MRLKIIFLSHNILNNNKNTFFMVQCGKVINLFNGFFLIKDNVYYNVF